MGENRHFSFRVRSGDSKFKAQFWVLKFFLSFRVRSGGSKIFGPSFLAVKKLFFREVGRFCDFCQNGQKMGPGFWGNFYGLTVPTLSAHFADFWQHF